METNEELVQEQLQQTHPDFVKMMEAFALIRQNIKDYKQNLEQRGQNRDLTEEETARIIDGIINGKGMKPNNPFLKDDKIEAVDMTNSVQDYIKHCRTHQDVETGIRPHYNIDGYQDFMQKKADDENMPPDEKDKAHAIASKVSSAKEEFEKTYEEQYYKAVFDILENKEGTNSVPDPSKYYWACEQLKRAEEFKYQIIETDKRQQISFKVKFKGQPEKVFKTVDFRLQQKDIQPVDSRDINELSSLSTQFFKNDKNGIEVAPAMTKAAEAGKNENEKLSPKEVGKFNNNPSSLFNDIKQKLGYDAIRDQQQWASLYNKSEVLSHVIFTLRNTKGMMIEDAQQEVAQTN